MVHGPIPVAVRTALLLAAAAFAVVTLSGVAGASSRSVCDADTCGPPTPSASYDAPTPGCYHACDATVRQTENPTTIAIPVAAVAAVGAAVWSVRRRLHGMPRVTDVASRLFRPPRRSLALG